MRLMQRFNLAVVVVAGIAMLVPMGSARAAKKKKDSKDSGQSTGSYQVLKTAKVGGEGGFDYISADVQDRRLFVPRNGPTGELMVFNLDTLAPEGSISGVSAGGAVVDPKSGNGFSTTKPLTMWDAKTLKVTKKINVDGRPDGIMFEPVTETVWVLSHQQPYVTIIDGKTGNIVGKIDLLGQPEQAVSDGNGLVYINISNLGHVAVVNAKEMRWLKDYDLSPQGSSGSGLAIDGKNHILFAYFRQPSPRCVILNAVNGDVLTTLPTGAGVDTVAFNPATMEAISAENAGTMTFIKESSPTSFAIEQTLQTMPGAKTLTLDTKTGHLLTMTAEFGPPPANAPAGPAGRPARGPMVAGSFSLLMVGGPGQS